MNGLAKVSPILGGSNMADIPVNSNTPIGNTDDDKTLKKLEAAISKIEAMDAATIKANDNLAKYTQSYRELNKELSSLVGNIKGIKFPNGNVKTSSSNSSDKLTKAASKVVDKEKKTQLKKVNDISSAAAKAVSGTALSALGPIMTATSGIAALGVAIKGLADITKSAETRITNAATALQKMGVALTEQQQQAVNATIAYNKLGNQLSRLGDDIGSFFSPLKEGFANVFSDILSTLGYSTAETDERRNQFELSAVSKARAQAFSGPSQRAIAGGIYDIALGKAVGTKYEGKEAEIAEAISNAVFTGRGAEEYGFNLSDNALIGYMAQQGVDIVNVEITDAMKTAYRYQMLDYEAKLKSTDAIAEQVKSWEQVGIEIDRCKGKLFAFDEVIQLTAVDTRIPEIDGGLSSGGNGSGDGNKKKGPYRINDVTNKIKKEIDRAKDIIDDADDTVDKLDENLDDTTEKIEKETDKFDDTVDKFDESLNKLDKSVNQFDLSVNNFGLHVNKFDTASNLVDKAADKIVSAANVNNTAADKMVNSAKSVSETASKLDTSLNGFKIAVDKMGNVITVIDSAAGTILTASESIGLSADEFVNAAAILEKAGPSIKAAMEEGGANAGEKIRQAIESAKINVTVTNKTIVTHVNEGGVKQEEKDDTPSPEDINKFIAELEEGDSEVTDSLEDSLRNEKNQSHDSKIIQMYHDEENMTEEEFNAKYHRNVSDTAYEYKEYTEDELREMLFGRSTENESEENKSKKDKVLNFLGELGASGVQGGKKLANKMWKNVTAGIFDIGELADFVDAMKQEGIGVTEINKWLPELAKFTLWSPLEFMGTGIYNNLIAEGMDAKWIEEENMDAISEWLAKKGIGVADLIVAGGAEGAGDIVALTKLVAGFFGWAQEELGFDSSGAKDTVEYLQKYQDSVDYITGQALEGNFFSIMGAALGISGTEQQQKLAQVNLGWLDLENLLANPRYKFITYTDENGNAAQQLIVNPYYSRETGEKLSEPEYADGGIGTKEIHGASLFEGNKAEAVIPLESEAGIRYLSDAMREASAGEGIGNQIVVNLTLRGLNLSDNESEWQYVGKKIAEVIDVNLMRRGELNYGSSF